MKKISLELPKYRLELHTKLVRRRKPLLDDPIIPTVSLVKKKYKKGSIPGRFVRYLANHKSIRKVFATTFVLSALIAGYAPQAAQSQVKADEIILEAETPLTTQKSMQYPVDVVKLNQGYSFFHPGIDLGGVKGSPIKPVMPGVVAYAGWNVTGYGNLIVLNHKNGIESYYAHLSKIEVKTGETVDMNTEIGKMGTTGHATGPHLHLEILQNGSHLNPLQVLSK